MYPFAAGIWLPDSYTVRLEPATDRFQPVVRRRYYKSTDTTSEMITHFGGVAQRLTAEYLAKQIFEKEIKLWN